MGSCFGRCRFSYRGRVNDEENLVEENKEEGNIFNILKFKKRKHTKFMENFTMRQQGEASNSYKLLNREDGPSTTQQRNFPNIQLQCLDAHSLLLSSKSGFPALRPDLYVSLNSSPGGSSLDLEWEHEYSTNNHHNPWTSLPENGTADGLSSDEEHTSSSGNSNKKQANQKDSHTCKAGSKHYANGSKNRGVHSSANTWSHISTPESLEWDQDEDQELKSEDSLDQETRDLLFQIEQLKNRVLNETGHFEYGPNDVES
ncbi:uncharacterized protein LOC129789748 [Lutzomyia longipalpis]|uniref:uncharacterized protein LOC129789748 n=1 Tax=Lutzomyia longipalpis TaxID=7200 RepID=UPI002483F44C|nr:uncharacterized protein LOC129789748 [Lutzomyia longipalpis]